MRASHHPLEPERLQTLADYAAPDAAAESDFDDIAALAASICETRFALVTLIDETQQRFLASEGTALTSNARDLAICAHALLQNDLLEIPDTHLDDRTADNEVVVIGLGVRFYAGVQLRAPNGMPIGTLCVLDDKPRTLNELQRQTLRTLARQVMTQLELRRTLRNQDILRGEMDHRVKNSLQTVQSVLRLYASKIKDPDALTAFAAIERRVTAIVALHKELHQSSSIAQVNMKPFMGGVLQHLAATCPDHIKVRTDIAAFELASPEATALAVVASECVANAIKHAFPDDRPGEITVSLAYTPLGEVQMVCRDNGIGTAHAGAARDPLTSLGLRIMDASAQQIGAQVERDSTPDGYVVTMTFKPLQPGMI
ncbi:Two-component sensor histidine kinase, contains HisKA and HATPase domains [Loktanella fryxellensis]|uniref:Two-component sensor histidine kinase, contains HisKA and HATPase domains n=1 Tax=Loktanella fryxellensis TaxID=245187 RepID=A0A1H8CSJ7_9RHOB|nr:histidine kinase dimerization/phosphoacceptor domain -containing protein [Loktanella fryxellensis]SEM98113.1 Two-component sensor histidine kinase, contains HisKA and HATPase domains [Loktanella fryxellensis]